MTSDAMEKTIREIVETARLKPFLELQDNGKSMLKEVNESYWTVDLPNQIKALIEAEKRAAVEEALNEIEEVSIEKSVHTKIKQLRARLGGETEKE